MTSVSFIEEAASPIQKQNLSSIASAPPAVAAPSQTSFSTLNRSSETNNNITTTSNLRPIQKFLQQLDRAVTPKDKENVLYKFAATVEFLFYDIPPARPDSREGNAMERDLQGLLEACFSLLQLTITDDRYVVEPPARFAALRALGAFVQGSAPVPNILSQDWKQPHVPLYLAVVNLLTKVFERGTTPYVFAIRCLSVLAIQALQILNPQSPVDCAVSSILSSPTRLAAHNNQNNQNNNNTQNHLDTSAALISHSSPANILISDSITNSSTASPSKRPNINNNGPTNSSPLRILPQLHPVNISSTSSMMMMQNNNTSNNDTSFINFESLYMDHLLQDPIIRPLVLELWKLWDAAGIDVRVFTACPESIHVYVPTRLLSSVGCVYRDFVTCPERPKMDKPWNGDCQIHIKTNIAVRSNVMYRILVEGYNYGVNSPIQTELVGAAKRHWDMPGGGDEEQLSRMCRDYANGCISTQYFSSDGFLVIKLISKSFFGVGFTASAWMIFHGHQPGFPIEGEVFHQEEDL